jgi:hypothetical protein
MSDRFNSLKVKKRHLHKQIEWLVLGIVIGFALIVVFVTLIAQRS